jgi:hypothetical protein
MKRLLLVPIVLVVLLSLVACGGSAVTTTQTNITVPATSATTQPAAGTTETSAAPTTTVTTVPPLPEGVAYTNILLIGSSEKDFSDPSSESYPMTHMLITLDPAGRLIKFTEFPYNLVVAVEAIGGTESMPLHAVSRYFDQDTTVAVLEKAFGISIDHWVLMNMSGVADIVDAMGGIEIDIKSLSLNDAALEISSILGVEWQDVTDTGPQVLSGVQTAGYFVDTAPEDENNRMVEEELLFRDRHENILRGVVGGIKLLGLTSQGLVDIANGVAGTYSTSITEEEWQAIADTAVYCLQNDPQFLFVPQEVKVSATSAEDLVYDPNVDVQAVQAFVQE